MDRIIVAALVLVGTVGPAFAGTIVRVPEPATMTLFGVGVGGAYLVKRFIGRK
jgi:PEP-CTERM motif